MDEEPITAKNPLTYTEVHSTIIGVVVALLAGYVQYSGYRPVALAVVLAFVALALGLGWHGKVPMAEKTLTREPWYALGGLTVAGALVLVALRYLA